MNLKLKLGHEWQWASSQHALPFCMFYSCLTVCHSSALEETGIVTKNEKGLGFGCQLCVLDVCSW